MLDIIRDLHLTVQNIVAGIALVSQNPGDSEFLRWEIKNGSNQPTVTISYKLPSELSQIAKSNYKSIEELKNKQEQENGCVSCLSCLHEKEDVRLCLDPYILADQQEGNSPHLASNSEFNVLDSPASDSEKSELSSNVFEPEVCIELQKDPSKECTSNHQSKNESKPHSLTGNLSSKRFTNSRNKKLLRGRRTFYSVQDKYSSKDDVLGLDDHLNIKEQNNNSKKDTYEKEADLIKETSNQNLRQFRLVLRSRNRVKHPIPETRRSSLHMDYEVCSYDEKINELTENEKSSVNERQCKIKKENAAEEIGDLASDDFSADCLDIDIFKPEIILKTKTLRNENISDPSKNVAKHSKPGDVEGSPEKSTLEPFAITFKELKKDFETNLFTCNYCKKSFKMKTNLKVHMRIHTGEKPFPCSYCGKCFKDPRDMKRHERIHTGEKPYACRFCSKRFTRNHHKTGHERIHTGEKPYSCKHCGRKFSQLRSKNVHERISCKKKTKNCEKEKSSTTV